MKEIRNYKHIRKKPEVHGLSINSFYLFSAIFIISILSLTTGFTIKKAIIVGIINAINLAVNKLILSNDKLLKRMLDEKFPSEISHLTRNFRNKKKK